MGNHSHTEDNQLKNTIGILLRAGVIISSAIVLFGGIIYLIRHGHEVPDYKVFQGMSRPYHTLPQLWDGIVHFKGRAIIQTGVLILLATPILRIVFSLFGFMKEKDKLYTYITLLVLAIILFSIFTGIEG